LDSSGAVTLVKGTVTVGAKIIPVSTSITLPGQPMILVGNTVPNLALQPGAYDAGLTQAQADTKFCQILGRGLGGAQHLAVTKKFWNQSDWSVTKNDLHNYVRFGTAVIFALWPAFPVGTAEQANLANFLSTIKSFGFGPSNCYIVLIQEPEVGTKITAANYQLMLEGYGPIVNNSGLPLVCDIGTGGGETALHSYGNAAIAAFRGGVQMAGLAQDFYAPQHIRNGATLNTLSGLADANGLAYGVFESGCVPSNFTVAQCTEYMNYIHDFMLARRSALKPCLPVLTYSGQRDATGAGDLTSPIGQDPSVTQPDFRIALWRRYWDDLHG
jgi:hypothetical protein